MNLLISRKLVLDYYFCCVCSVLTRSLRPPCSSEGEVLALDLAEMKGREGVSACGEVSGSLGRGVKGISLMGFGLL
jgi:hypothetical protein